MSSYVIVLMVSAFLSTPSKVITLGRSFMETLRYYGKEFDASYLMIIEGRKIVRKMFPSPELMIYDIFSPDTNAASSVTLFDNIREVIGKAYDTLCKGRATGSLLGHALANFYNLYEPL